MTATAIMTRKELFWARFDATPRAEHYTLHREYWGAYVKEFGIRVHNANLLARCKQAVAAGDEHMNSPYTALREWDAMSAPQRVIQALRDNGEGYSASANTCLFKEAARQQIEAAETIAAELAK